MRYYKLLHYALWCELNDPFAFEARFLGDRYNGDQKTFAESALDGISGEPAFTRVQHATKVREIWRPNDAMRKVHHRAKVLLADDLWYAAKPWGRPLSPYVHSDARYLYRVDIKNAFGSVDVGRLAQFLVSPGVILTTSPWASSEAQSFELLQKYFASPNGGLYQGGPASPYLFHLYARKLLDNEFLPGVATDSGRDLTIPGWSDARGLNYSRYVDDLVFTSRRPIGRRVRAEINRRIRVAGFEVNTAKTRMYDVRRKPVHIHGLSVRYCESGLNWRSYQGGRLKMVDSGLRFSLPPKTLGRIEGMLHLVESGRLVNLDQFFGYKGWFYCVYDCEQHSAREFKIHARFEALRGEAKRRFNFGPPTAYDELMAAAMARGALPSYEERLLAWERDHAAKRISALLTPRPARIAGWDDTASS